MRVEFESSHVYGRYPDGRLVIGIQFEDETIGQTVWDDVSFAVPGDFHSHNDSVAAALMTLVGRQFSEVGFNFPISAYCAETLRGYYGEIEFGPVDPALTPRERGRRIGLLFSGGVDSTATWIILNRALGGDFAVITNEYPGYYQFEAKGYGGYRRDVSSWTDLREKRWDRSGRFNYALALLFADYLDLGSVCSGHTIAHGTHFGSLKYGNPAQWLEQDLVVNAGGLDELHVLRSLSTMGLAKLYMTYGQERIEAALNGCDLPGQRKRYTKELIFRTYHEDAGLPVPTYLQNLTPPVEPVELGRVNELDYRVFYLLKRGDRDEVFRLCPGLANIDTAPLERLALNFLGRYSTNIVELLPFPLRIQVMDIFHECDIYPYDERDWHELGLLGDFLSSVGATYLPPRLA